MKGIRTLLRLGVLALVASLLVVGMTTPALGANKTCHDNQMLPQVRITEVAPATSSMVWDSSKLLYFGDGEANTYSVGQLVVKFRDINTEFDFDGYKIVATPSDDDDTNEPGTSDNLGVDEETRYVGRPSNVGSEVSTTLNLEPGTKYYVTVVAINRLSLSDTRVDALEISEAQSNQDSSSGVTLLSPPFLGGFFSVTSSVQERNLWLDNDDYRGSHYLVYKGDGQLHSFRWLNPEFFGPFDHVWKKDKEEGADILCIQDDGKIEDCGDSDVEGITHYRLTIEDVDTGKEEYEGFVAVSTDEFYEKEFNLANGEYRFAVEAGLRKDRRWTPMSEKAVVQLTLPDDFRVIDQSWAKYRSLMIDEVVDHVTDKKENSEAWRESIWNYNDRQDDHVPATGTVTDTTDPNDTPYYLLISDETKFLDEDTDPVGTDWARNLTAYLNNIYN